MDRRDRRRRFVSVNGWRRAIVWGAALIATASASGPVRADCTCGKWWPHLWCHAHTMGHAVGPGDIVNGDTGGTWYWLRSPEQERRVVMGLYNRYCVRCHGVDGRGVWDIPDVPDFTNTVWQATRPDDYRSRVILEGRGAVMPAFRGTLTLEEACAMARYLHTFVPGTEVSRPGLGPAEPAAPAAGLRPPSRPAPATATPSRFGR
jgi:Cytochrome C oxidase, cbb3-type, subunit III